MVSTQVVVPHWNCSTGRTMMSITMLPQHRILRDAQQMHRPVLSRVFETPCCLLLDQNLAELPDTGYRSRRQNVVDSTAFQIADRRAAQVLLRPQRGCW